MPIVAKILPVFIGLVGGFVVGIGASELVHHGTKAAQAPERFIYAPAPQPNLSPVEVVRPLKYICEPVFVQPGNKIWMSCEEAR